MPLSKYFGGHGQEVASNMQKQYGSKWKSVFYATANARKKHMVGRAMKKTKNTKRDMTMMDGESKNK